MMNDVRAVMREEMRPPLAQHVCDARDDFSPLNTDNVAREGR